MSLDPARPGVVVSRATARLRLHIARRPWIRRAVIATAALVLVADLGQRHARLDEARRAWGAASAVAVAAGPLTPGHVITPADVEWRRLPAPATPASVAIDPIGSVVRHPLVTGEVLLAHHIGARGTGALLDPGEVAIAVAPPPPGALAVDDVVDLVAAADPLSGAAGAAPATVLATGGRVVAIEPERVVIAVAEADGPAAAAAATIGAVAIVTRREPPPPPRAAPP